MQKMIKQLFFHIRLFSQFYLIWLLFFIFSFFSTFGQFFGLKDAHFWMLQTSGSPLIPGFLTSAWAHFNTAHFLFDWLGILLVLSLSRPCKPRELIALIFWGIMGLNLIILSFGLDGSKTLFSFLLPYSSLPRIQEFGGSSALMMTISMAFLFLNPIKSWRFQEKLLLMLLLLKLLFDAWRIFYERVNLNADFYPLLETHFLGAFLGLLFPWLRKVKPKQNKNPL